MPIITLHQLRERTKHELISDDEACCMDPVLGPTTVRNAERAKETRYPLHRQLRQAAVRHFQDKGWDVVPHGIGVWGAKKAMADLAIAKRRRIVLVECLTPAWVYYRNAASKKRLEKFFPLWFVVEDPVTSGDASYKHRVERLARRNRVFVWSKGGSLTLFPKRTLKRTSCSPPSRSGQD